MEEYIEDAYVHRVRNAIRIELIKLKHDKLFNKLSEEDTVAIMTERLTAAVCLSSM